MFRYLKQLLVQIYVLKSKVKVACTFRSKIIDYYGEKSLLHVSAIQDT